MFQVGDKVKQEYIYDNCPHNNMVAIIKSIRPYNFYPNGDYTVIEQRYQYELLYANGDTVYADCDMNGCGILSRFEKVE